MIYGRNCNPILRSFPPSLSRPVPSIRAPLSCCSSFAYSKPTRSEILPSPIKVLTWQTVTLAPFAWTGKYISYTWPLYIYIYIYTEQRMSHFIADSGTQRSSLDRLRNRTLPRKRLALHSKYSKRYGFRKCATMYNLQSGPGIFAERRYIQKEGTAFFSPENSVIGQGCFNEKVGLA